ncbi:MAG: ORF6N domain-containing protein [Candidatus Uhrbacteria bacterium]|nr:ORF6N domain-containing protein [Candidatus Uhrbacteria bacterium]
METSLIPNERVEQKILLIRGQRVMLDRDLALLYGVSTKVLNQSVKRNILRFPLDFMFKLSNEEVQILKSQFVTSSSEWGGRRKLPTVFTELGVAMLSSVLKSERAIMVNIQIMRTFTKLRQMIEENDTLRRRLEVMEKQYDDQFKIVFDTLKRLLDEKDSPAEQIGFRD